MRCFYCNSENTKVLDKRENQDGTIVRRRRECLDCSKRFTTYEKAETPQLIVLKKDGSKDVFDKNKLYDGVIKACKKRNITLKQIEDLVKKVENDFLYNKIFEVNSSEIGKLVSDYLMKIDTVAYIRFASVYKDFTNLESFEKELKKLKKIGEINGR